ncbi:hypothetical protein ABK040_014000 [Willaertia magna]
MDQQQLATSSGSTSTLTALSTTTTTLPNNNNNNNNANMNDNNKEKDLIRLHILKVYLFEMFERVLLLSTNKSISSSSSSNNNNNKSSKNPYDFALESFYKNPRFKNYKNILLKGIGELSEDLKKNFIIELDKYLLKFNLKFKLNALDSVNYNNILLNNLDNYGNNNCWIYLPKSKLLSEKKVIFINNSFFVKSLQNLQNENVTNHYNTIIVDNNTNDNNDNNQNNLKEEQQKMEIDNNQQTFTTNNFTINNKTVDNKINNNFTINQKEEKIKFLKEMLNTKRQILEKLNKFSQIISEENLKLKKETEEMKMKIQNFYTNEIDNNVKQIRKSCDLLECQYWNNNCENVGMMNGSGSGNSGNLVGMMKGNSKGGSGAVRRKMEEEEEDDRMRDEDEEEY